MKALPVAMAIGAIHSGTITGKLNGVMPATTPTGSRNEKTSMPVETWSEYSPLSNCGMPQANSMTSRPRPISPLASLRTLPCSAVISWASSSTCNATSSRNLNSTAVRLASDMSPQDSAAFLAMATVSLRSSGPARRSSAVMAPVAGL
jgi:hypothetical protein